MGAVTLEEAIDTVEWKSDHGADFSIEGDKLKLVVWVKDSDRDDFDDSLHALDVTQSITDEDGRDQIRNIIHWYLCHEADEQLEFNGERPFYPEHPLSEELRA